MAQKQSGKSFRSFLGVAPSKPTPKDSVLVIVDAQNEYGIHPATICHSQQIPPSDTSLTLS